MTRSSILFQRHRPAEIKLWDFPSGRLLQTLTNHQADLTGLAFTPDDRLLASGSVDQIVRLWDVASVRGSRCMACAVLDGDRSGGSEGENGEQVALNLIGYPDETARNGAFGFGEHTRQAVALPL